MLKTIHCKYNKPGHLKQRGLLLKRYGTPERSGR